MSILGIISPFILEAQKQRYAESLAETRANLDYLNQSKLQSEKYALEQNNKLEVLKNQHLNDVELSNIQNSQEYLRDRARLSDSFKYDLGKIAASGVEGRKTEEKTNALKLSYAWQTFPAQITTGVAGGLAAGFAKSYFNNKYNNKKPPKGGTGTRNDDDFWQEVSDKIKKSESAKPTSDVMKQKANSAWQQRLNTQGSLDLDKKQLKTDMLNNTYQLFKGVNRTAPYIVPFNGASFVYL